MQSVVLLALLWQTSIVVCLAASNNNAPSRIINAPNSTFPLLGTTVWSTNVGQFFPLEPRALSSDSKEIFAQGFFPDGPTILSFDTVTGQEQTLTGLPRTWDDDFVFHLPFFALTNKQSGVTVYHKVNKTSIIPIHTIPVPTNHKSGPNVDLYSLGNHLFWFTTTTDSTFLTKIDPRTGVWSTSQTSAPNSEVFIVGANHLFTFDRATRRILTSFSAATGEVAWSLKFEDGDNKNSFLNAISSPFSDALLITDNFSPVFSLYNSTTGELIWTSMLEWNSTTNTFFPDTIVMTGGINTNRFAGVDPQTGKILWQKTTATLTNKLTNCGLGSNILAYADFQFSFALFGVDAQTGKSMFEFPIHKDYDIETFYCFQNDILLTHSILANNVVKQTTVKRIKFAPHP